MRNTDTGSTAAGAEWLLREHDTDEVELTYRVHYLINRTWGMMAVLPDSPVWKHQWVEWVLADCRLWSLWHDHDFAGYILLEKPGTDDTFHVGLAASVPNWVRIAAWQEFLSQIRLQCRVLHVYITADRKSLKRAAERRGWRFDQEPDQGGRWHGRFQVHAEPG